METRNHAHFNQFVSDELTIQNLPDEIFVEIFKWVRPEIILSSFALVSRLFFKITQIDLLWHFKLNQHFPLIRRTPFQDINALSIFKESYKSTYKINNLNKYNESDKKRKERKQIARLFSCVKEGDLETLKAANIRLRDFFDKEDLFEKSLFNITVSSKQQVVLNYIYEQARFVFMRDNNQAIDVKIVDAKGKTLLFWAAQTNQAEAIITPLIEAGAKVNQAMYDGATPLFAAAQEGHAEIVQLLIKSGAKVNQAMYDGATPLFAAAQEGHAEIVQLLIKSGANVKAKIDKSSETSLFVAAQNGHAKVVQLLIEAGANVNQPRNYDDTTPLIVAVSTAIKN